MLFLSKRYEEDEPHTIVSNSLGQGKRRVSRSLDSSEFVKFKKLI